MFISLGDLGRASKWTEQQASKRAIWHMNTRREVTYIPTCAQSGESTSHARLGRAGFCVPPSFLLEKRKKILYFNFFPDRSHVSTQDRWGKLEVWSINKIAEVLYGIPRELFLFHLVIICFFVPVLPLRRWLSVLNGVYTRYGGVMREIGEGEKIPISG